MKPRNACSPYDPQAVWTAHLQTIFKTLGIAPGTVADNLAEGLAVYCQTFHPRGVQTSDLRLLIARGFCAIGDTNSAAQVLNSMQPHAHHVTRWLEILSELHQFPDLLPYFSAGVIRPADWAGAQQDRMWLLDFELFTPQASEQHEIMLYRTIRAMVEKMFPFWDATQGEGTLGVKHLSALKLDALTGKKHPSLSSPAALLGYIAGLLAKATEQREWKATPVMLNLDL